MKLIKMSVKGISYSETQTGAYALILNEEKGEKPLSDDLIAKLVSKNGVKLARRTVAKYREMLNIPSSSERKRRAKLDAMTAS